MVFHITTSNSLAFMSDNKKAYCNLFNLLPFQRKLQPVTLFPSSILRKKLKIFFHLWLMLVHRPPLIKKKKIKNWGVFSGWQKIGSNGIKVTSHFCTWESIILLHKMWCFMKRLANGSATTRLAALFLNLKVQSAKIHCIYQYFLFSFQAIQKLLQQNSSPYFQHTHKIQALK